MNEIDSHPRRRVAILGTELSYVDVGTGDPIVFLHGNPTWSYLWRNVIPHVADLGRCLAPDLVGMGDSGPAPDGAYRFRDHARYLDAWFAAVVPDQRVVLVLHDWGSALGFDWACRHKDRVKAIAYMEAIVKPRRWNDIPEGRREMFRRLRSPEGEQLVLQDNYFVETILPKSILRVLSDKEMAAYRRPFSEPTSRIPTLEFPRELPIDGEPADVVERVEQYASWLTDSRSIPKLFISAEPGSLLVGSGREFCRSWPNQTEISVAGIHFVQEDAPDQIGDALRTLIQANPASNRS
jgi:haloalkane dehalogenase